MGCYDRAKEVISCKIDVFVVKEISARSKEVKMGRDLLLRDVLLQCGQCGYASFKTLEEGSLFLGYDLAFRVVTTDAPLRSMIAHFRRDHGSGERLFCGKVRILDANLGRKEIQIRQVLPGFPAREERERRLRRIERRSRLSEDF
jgi:ribosomal protein S27AE